MVPEEYLRGGSRVDFGAQAWRGGGEFAVYFPGEPRVQPDGFVVPGAEQMPLRDSWVVSKEGKAPSFVLEITGAGPPGE